MSYNRLIHDYLDGELDQTSEDALFTHLSGSTELRSEFNQQIKLHNMAGMDMKRITVPAELTGAVFSHLGFAAANSSGALMFDTANVSGSGLMGFTRRYFGFILLLLFLFSAGSSLYLMNENSTLKGLLGSVTSVKSNIPVMESYERSQINPSEAFAGSEDISQVLNSSSDEDIQKHNQGSKSSGNSYTNGKLGNSGSAANLIAENNENEMSDIANNADLGPNNSLNRYLVINSNPYSADYNENSYLKNRVSAGDNSFRSGFPSNSGMAGFIYDGTNLSDLNLPKWSIQIRRMNSHTNYPPVSVGNESSILNDNSFSVWYHYLPDFSFGIETGIEPIAQEFSYNNSNYSQTPNFLWAGLSLRYNPNELLMPYTMNPYGAGTVAFTAIGPLLKLQGGLTFNVSNPLSFFVGAEYGMLIYNVGGNLYSSGKIGYTGGININLR